MGAIQKIKKNEESSEEPESLHGRAMDNLEYIRDTMERSTEFTAVPGYGGVFMGITAFGAGYIASLQPTIELWTLTWILEAYLAVTIGTLMMWQKSKYVKSSLDSEPAKKFALGFAPSILSAMVLTVLLGSKGFAQYLPTVWLTLYGSAVVAGGAYSVKAVQVKGWVFIGLGAVSIFVPHHYGNWLMVAGFGALNVIFGLIIARRHGG